MQLGQDLADCEDQIDGGDDVAGVFAANEFALILVHGAGGGAWEWVQWEAAIRVARPSWRCISVHLSPPAGKDYETTAFDDYVEQVIAAAQQGVDRSKCKLVLVGASMGGSLVAKASETLLPDAIVFVCTTVPLLGGCSDEPSAAAPLLGDLSPARIKWSGGHLQATIDAMPDATLEMCQYACARWRDESGAVCNAIRAGIKCNLLVGTTPMCVVIPKADTSVPSSLQEKFAKDIRATVLEYDDMSHVGPLLGERGKEVAIDVVSFLEKNSS